MSRDALAYRWPYLVALSAALFLARPVAAQPGEKIVPLEGTQAFRQILSFAGLQPLGGFAALHEADPQQTVLIIFGSTVGPLRELRSVQGALPQTLKAFIDSG